MAPKRRGSAAEARASSSSSGTASLKQKKTKKGRSRKARSLKREQGAAEKPATAKHPKYDVFTLQEAKDFCYDCPVGLGLSLYFDVLERGAVPRKVGKEVTEVAKFAIEFRNQEKDVPNQLCFKEVIKCNSRSVGPYSKCYITVDAEDAETKEVNTYQAIVAVPAAFRKEEKRFIHFQKAPDYIRRFGVK